jgi:myo-inositol 2-dehydrogenase / D-chiro-inositol 1-dehydrogenase
MDQRIRIAILGVGRIGRLHAEILGRELGDSTRVTLVVDPRTDAAHEVAARCGAARVATDWREATGGSDVDALVVCTPTDSHAELVTAAAAAGKHVFCEKPLALELESTETTLEAVTRAGILLQIGFNRRFDPSFGRIARGVREGEIGTPELVRITSRDPQPPPPAYVRSSGGLFVDMTIHDFDMARFLTGDEVVEVHASGATLVDSEIARAGDIDTAIVTLRFANGALGCIDNSRRAVYGYDQRVEVHGSKGALVAGHLASTTVSRWDAAGRTADRPHDFFIERYREAYRAELRAFVDAVREHRPTPVGATDALQALRIALAARRSHVEHRPVRLEEIRSTRSEAA